MAHEINCCYTLKAVKYITDMLLPTHRGTDVDVWYKKKARSHQ